MTEPFFTVNLANLAHGHWGLVGEPESLFVPWSSINGLIRSEPWSPICNLHEVRTLFLLTLFKLFGTASVTCTLTAETHPGTWSESSVTIGWTLAPSTPLTPELVIVLDQGNTFGVHGCAGQQITTVLVVYIKANTDLASKGWWRITTWPSSMTNANVTRLTTSTPVGPTRPSSMPGAVGYFQSTTIAFQSSVGRLWFVTWPFTALTVGIKNSLVWITGIVALKPCWPKSPASVHLKSF